MILPPGNRRAESVVRSIRTHLEQQILQLRPIALPTRDLDLHAQDAFVLLDARLAVERAPAEAHLEEEDAEGPPVGGEGVADVEEDLCSAGASQWGGAGGKGERDAPGATKAVVPHSVRHFSSGDSSSFERPKSQRTT